MKTSILFLSIMGFSIWASAQETIPRRVVRNAKDQSVNRAEIRSDQGVQRGLDKVEEGIGNLFRRRNRDGGTDSGNQSGAQNGGNQGDFQEGSDTAYRSEQEKRKAFTRFDFVSGEKVIAYENFEQDAIGDFPLQWNTNSGGEVVVLEGSDEKWFFPNKSGLYVPDFVNVLPENFTIEFDLVAFELSNNQGGLMVGIVQHMDDLMQYDPYFSPDPQVSMVFKPYESNQTEVRYYSTNANGSKLENINTINGIGLDVVRVSIWRQNQRIRVYLDEVKVFDLPRAFSPGVNYGLVFWTNIWDGDMFFTDLKIAVGEPDTRSRLLTEGRLVSNGITFDTGSDVLRPNSYGVLREIAQALSQDQSAKVQIIGHTDSDGNPDLNLRLSKARAESVRKALIEDFGINGSRLTTDGKGQSEPVAPNNTAEGKAQNRRVEFVKL